MDGWDSGLGREKNAAFIAGTLRLRVSWITVCMLSRFSPVWLFVTLWTVARQAPLSMGFCSQEYWSGLPCPPPGDLPGPGIEPCLLGLLHWQMGSLPLYAVVSHSVVSDSLWPHGLLCPWDSPDRNTGVGCHVLLQGIFPTQGSNRGLLHCRWILYWLSYQGSPLKGHH